MLLIAALTAMTLCVQPAIAEDRETLRVVYGTFADDLTYEAESESSVPVTKAQDEYSCYIDIEASRGDDSVWGLYRVEDGLEYVVQDASFDGKAGKLTFSAKLSPADLRFEYGVKRSEEEGSESTMKAQSLSASAKGSSIPSTIQFRHGYLLYYGYPGSGHRTATFHVITPDGEKLTAYCVNPPKGQVSERELHTTPLFGGTVKLTDTDMLAMVLYYSPGGPGYDASIWPAMPDKYFGDETDTKLERHYCCAHVLATIASFGNKVNAYDDCSDEFIEWFKDKIAGEFVASLKTRWSKLSVQLRNTYRDRCFMLDPVTLDGAGSNAQELAVASASLPSGDGKLVKKSSNTALTAGNACYSLKGALYGVFETKEKASSRNASDAITTAKTDSEGNASFSESLPVGTYYVAEIEPSKGYLLDERVYSVQVKQGEMAVVNGTAGVVEQPVDAPIKLALAKWDSSLGKAASQGAGTLGKAQFEMKFFADHYGASNLPSKATRSWVFETAEDGTVDFRNASAYKVGGDDLYKNSDGQFTLPLGTVSVVETKAPAGYLLENGEGDPKTYVFQIVQDVSAPGGARVKPLNYSGSVTESNTPVISDVPIRGDYRLVKEASTDTHEDASQEQKRILLKGIQFQIVNDNSAVVVSPETGEEVAPGDVVCTITTDENGFASTRNGKAANGWAAPSDWQGALAYGTYVVREVIPDAVQADFAKEHGANLTPADDWKITIGSAGQYDPAPLVHNGIPQSPLRIVKLDAETGEQIPLHASFKLFDHKGDLVTYTSRYPEKKTIDTFTSNERGELTLPMMLTGGNYTVREVMAPQGYVIDDGETSFTVEENRTWDNPIEVTIKNKPIKGIIEIHKADSASKEPLSGAQYAVTAAEDIVTPDKTLRKAAGETVAVLVTDGEGVATTPELYPGSYKVYETQAPDGYALDTTEHIVSVEPEGQDVPVVTVHEELVDAPTTLRIRKVDVETGEFLPNAMFIVVKDETVASSEPVSDDASSGETNQENAPDGSVEAQGDDLKDDPQSGQAADADTDKGSDASAGANENVSISENTGAGEGEGASKNESAGTPAGENADTRSERTVVTDENGVAEVTYLSHGNYHLREAKPPIGYHASDGGEWVGFSVNEKGLIGTEEAGFSDVLIITMQNARNQIGTSASIEGAKVASADGIVSLVDVVSYTGCTPGSEYVLTGVLHIARTDENGNRDDGGELKDRDGNPVTATTTFIPDLPDGNAEVVFTFDASTLAGQSVVAFEQMQCGGEFFAEHADIQDADQMVTFKPSLATTLTDAETGCHTARATEKEKLVDTVEYRGLIAGEQYSVRGTLMDKESGEPLTHADGKQVIADLSFEAGESDGVVTLEFIFDSSELAGKEVVAFEKLYRAGAEIAAHEDLEDKAQTVTFPTLATSAKDAQDDDPFVEPEKTAKIIDDVTYTGLTPGRTYLVEGELHGVEEGDDGKREDGGLLKEKDGKPITSSTTFVPEKPEGEVEVAFEFDASELGGRKAVVFETLKQESSHPGEDGEKRYVEVVRHHDANDEEQTVDFRKPTVPEMVVVTVEKFMPKTGDNGWVPIVAILGAMSFLSACAAAISFTLRKRARQVEEAMA